MQNPKPDYSVVLDEFVTSIENEQKADNKKFYNESDGSRRAQHALEILAAARVRLQQFVRA